MHPHKQQQQQQHQKQQQQQQRNPHPPDLVSLNSILLAFKQLYMLPTISICVYVP